MEDETNFIKAPCPKNPTLQDLYIIGELGLKELVFCPHTGEFAE